VEFGQLPPIQLNNLIGALRARVPNHLWLFGAVALLAVIVGVAGALSLKNNGKDRQKIDHVVNGSNGVVNPVPQKRTIKPAENKPAEKQAESNVEPDVPSTAKPELAPVPDPEPDPEPEIHYEEPLPETVHETASLPEPVPDLVLKEPVIVPYAGFPAWRKYARNMADIPPGPQIAIVIDDAGIDRRRTAQAINLPGPLTIAFLTYAGALEKQTKAARQAGHEIMVHMPMQPMNADVDPGPNVLTNSLSPEETLKRIVWGLDRLQGYVGVNNHMGSRFTEYAGGMEILLKELKRRGLLFLDSRTSTKSVGAGIALAIDLPFAERNVFLDNVPEVAAVNKQLKLLESVAKRQGYAIAIGHPRDATIFALSQWLAVIAEKGLVQVPISAIVARRQGMAQVGLPVEPKKSE